MHTSFVDPLCFLCLVFLMLLRLLIADLWSPAVLTLVGGVYYIYFLLAVSLVRSGTCLYHFLILVIFLALMIGEYTFSRFMMK